MLYRNIKQYARERKKPTEKEKINRFFARMPYLDRKMSGILSYFLSKPYEKASLDEIKSTGERIRIKDMESYKALANLEVEGLVEGERIGNETPEIFRLTELGRKIGNALEKGLLDAEKSQITQSNDNKCNEKPKKVISI